MTVSIPPESNYSTAPPLSATCSGRSITQHQSDTGSAGIFSRRTNQIQGLRVYSHDGPIKCNLRRTSILGLGADI
eukprot:479092-Pyramimonas_sp.AAC.1